MQYFMMYNVVTEAGKRWFNNQEVAAIYAFSTLYMREEYVNIE